MKIRKASVRACVKENRIKIKSALNFCEKSAKLPRKLRAIAGVAHYYFAYNDVQNCKIRQRERERKREREEG